MAIRREPSCMVVLVVKIRPGVVRAADTHAKSCRV